MSNTLANVGIHCAGINKTLMFVTKIIVFPYQFVDINANKTTGCTKMFNHIVTCFGCRVSGCILQRISLVRASPLE